MREQGIRITGRPWIFHAVKRKKEKKKKKQKQYSEGIFDDGRRGEERRVYEFRWMKGQSNVKRQEPSPPLYGPVRENNGRTVSRSCFMGCNCGAGPWRERNPDRSVTVLTFATTTKTSFCESFRATLDATQRSTSFPPFSSPFSVRPFSLFLSRMRLINARSDKLEGRGGRRTEATMVVD